MISAIWISHHQGSCLHQRGGLRLYGIYYGDRSHGPKPDYVSELTKILQRTFDRGGNVVIPSFAVGRTQEMLYFIREIKEKGLVKGHGNFRCTLTARLPSRRPASLKIPTGLL